MLRQLLTTGLLVTLCACSRKTTDAPPPETAAPSNSTDSLSAGWSRLPATGLGTLYDVHFTDSLQGYVCGSGGAFRSTDGGHSWTLVQAAPQGQAFTDAAAYGPRAAFVANDSRIFLGNGAQTQLLPQTTPDGTPNTTPAFTQAFFANSDTAYFADRGFVWRSVDGGLRADTVHQFGTGIQFQKSMFFHNGREGWMLRQGSLYRTADAGNSWSLAGTTGGSNPGNLQFIDSQTGFFSIDKNVFVTTDGGATSRIIFTSPVPGVSPDFHFFDAQNGFVCAGKRVYRTTNGGNSWMAVASVRGNLSQLHFTNAHNGWVCGDSSTVLCVRL